MRGLPDNNADGAEGTSPYIYLDFCRFVLEEWREWRGGVVVEVVVLESIVFVQFE